MRVPLRLSITTLACVVVALDGTAACAQYHSSIYTPGSGTATSLIPLLPGPQLFIDDYLIESASGLSRRVNVPQRDPAIPNPIVTGIEDGNTAPYTTVLQDPQTGQYRIWYNSETGGNVAVAMMESDDGIHWQRPHQLVTTPKSGAWGAAVIDDGPDYADPSQRYKLGWWADGLNISTSPDGLTWTPMGGTLVAHDHDINNIWYDPLRKRYVGIVSTSTEGPTWSGKRRVTMETASNDLVHWADPWYILTPDDTKDLGQTQFYAMQGHLARGDLWIGLVKVLRDDLVAPGVPSGAYGVGYTTLAWTRDGVHWVRDQEHFFDPDPTVGAWDHAHAWLDYQVLVGDEVYLYYGGYQSGHKYERYTQRQLGLVRMDLDRYVSRDAGTGGGTLRTAPVLMVGVDGMTVNARVDGTLRARLVDLAGQPIAGFDFGDCTPVSGNSLSHTIQWSTPLASLGLTPVRIEFTMHNAQLYGFSLDGPGQPAPPPIETQTFNDEIAAFVAGWRGRNHTPADGFGADLGFRASNHAGGTAGEMGGTMPGRASEFVYYADTTLGGDPSQADVLTASGRFRVDSVATGFNGGFELGFFDANTTVRDTLGASMGGVHDLVGIRFLDGAGDDTTLRWHARAGGLGSDLGTPLAVGEDYFFDLAYDPNGAAAGWGKLSVDLRRAADGVSLGPVTITFSSTGAPLELNAFGLIGLDLDSSSAGANVYLDNLQYGHREAHIQFPTESQSFDQAAAAAAAGWTGFRHTPGDGLGVNLGFRTSNHAGGSAGEAGGAMPSRTPGFAYYADTDLGGSLTETDRITAQGRFTIDSLASGFDGGFELGFFNANDFTRVASGSGVGGVAEAIAIRLLEQDASSLRWLIRAGDLTSYSQTTLQVGVDYLFNLLYEPSGGLSGPGSLAVEFRRADTGAIASSALLGEIELAGLDLNAFGLISLDFGYISPVANVYIDDLVYTNVAQPLIPGDANGDGSVDDLDASILAANWQRTGGATWAQGDFNDDGYVDDLDASILASHWQQTAAGGASVPEPSAVVLVLGAVVLLASWRFRYGRRS